ncbi:hypothetical protein AAV35_14175 [Salimicrobium jeotgali]|uniref:Nuclease SbcCD subunit C n=1 Tax=Salimicrobium jeotgali TaxID=1230341 RepID=K2FP78_9BACI|nr:SbcC/MukB-like Walker B domain-containing protein [Salimicrobium jeotgali]APC65586.1 hypothetical protein AAV35_14175 [Salimicrobium jeotgali]EKE32646.1 SbcC family exonuclease [Salimicrobium jeotgali]MBM7695371.1 exonuclease SbcC [Salimicrobium jeotgali]
MEITELTIQAFGPYKHRQTISFEKLKQYPIFLITGPTGAGKTTVFDAICFALYGKASGSDRDQETLRSQLSRPEEKTFVSFTFRINNKTYALERAPKQIVAKQRGEGTKEEPARAELYFDPEGGRQLLASKVREVDQLVEDMLGLNYEQFRKMMMIPQGEFRKLISENSREREEVLRKIFDTSLYMDVTERLKQKRAGLEGEITKSRDRAKDILARLYLDEEELPEHPADAVSRIQQDIDGKYELITRIGEQKNAQEKAKNEIEEKLKKIEQHNELVKEREDYAKSRTEIEARKQEIEKKKSRVAKGEEAAKLEVYDKQVREAENSLTELEQQRDATKKAFAEVEQQKDRKQKEQKKCDEKEEERLQLKRKMDRLEEDRERFPEIREKEKYAAVKKQRKEELKKELHQQKESGRRCRQKEKDLSDRLVQFQGIDQKYFECNGKVDRQEGEKKTLNRLYSSAAKWAEKQKEREKQEAFLREKREERIHKEKEWTTLTSSQKEHQAYLLMLELVPGEPCPVCGSDHHPSPARPEEAVDEEMIEAAEKAVKQLKEQEDQLQKNVYRVKAEEEAKKQELEANGYEVEKTPAEEVAAKLDEEIKEVTRTLHTLKKETESLKAKTKEREETERTYREVQKSLEEKREQYENLKEQYDATEREIYEKEAELKEFYRSLSQFGSVEELTSDMLERMYEDIRARYEKMTQDKQRIDEELSRLAEKLSGLEGTMKQQKETYEKAEKTVRDTREQFKQMFEETSFSSVEDYEESKITSGEVEAVKKEIQDYENSKNIIESRLKELEEKIGEDALYIPTDSLTLRRQEITEEMNNIQERLTQKEYEKTHNEKSLRELQAVLKEQGGKEELFYEVGDLARMTNGDNPLRLSLERYVLASYLDEILLQANQRLQVMTDYRYQLKRSEEIAKRGAQSGLDLEVMDQYTGLERSVRTLSGGEGFKAALSLALGMADVVQSHAGGIQLNTLFIDEGFGTLDDISLQQAIECLKSLQDGNRLLGIISHVPQLKEEIPVQMQVSASGSGSSVTIKYS